MPTYQYACTECGEQLERVQKFSDDPLTECPVCHGRLRKVFSPVGIVFKGSGFYRTDSRAGSNGNGSLTGGKDGKDSKPESISKSESSPSDKGGAKSDSSGSSSGKDSAGSSSSSSGSAGKSSGAGEKVA